MDIHWDEYHSTTYMPCTLGASGSRLSAADCPISQGEKDATATRPYWGLVGKLAWLALSARPNLAFTTISVASFGHNPGCVHWEAVKRVPRYLEGTKGGVSSSVVTRCRSRVIQRWTGGVMIGARSVKIGCGAVSWK